MTELEKMLVDYFQSKYKLSESEAHDKVSDGVVEQVDAKTISHLHKTVGAADRRDLYLINLDNLVLIRSEERDKYGEWNRIII